jgi:cell wall assembly regulator SMI1
MSPWLETMRAVAPELVLPNPSKEAPLALSALFEHDVLPKLFISPSGASYETLPSTKVITTQTQWEHTYRDRYPDQSPPYREPGKALTQGEVGPWLWHLNWLPFATGQQTGQRLLFVDLAAGPLGHNGQVVELITEIGTKAVIASSLAELLEAQATGLRDGTIAVLLDAEKNVSVALTSALESEKFEWLGRTLAAGPLATALENEGRALEQKLTQAELMVGALQSLPALHRLGLLGRALTQTARASMASEVVEAFENDAGIEEFFFDEQTLVQQASRR